MCDFCNFSEPLVYIDKSTWKKHSQTSNNLETEKIRGIQEKFLKKEKTMHNLLSSKVIKQLLLAL